MAKRSKTIVLVFKRIGDFETDLINRYLELGFNLIIPFSGDYDSSILKPSLKALLPGSVTFKKCNFYSVKSAQKFQNYLFEQHYPIDIVITNFTDEVQDLDILGYSTNEFKIGVEHSLTSYFNLMKCIFPLFNTNSSFLLNLELNPKAVVHNQNGLNRLASAAKHSLLQTLNLENKHSYIHIANIEISDMLHFDQGSVQNAIALESMEKVFEYIIKLTNFGDKPKFKHQLFLTGE